MKAGFAYVDITPAVGVELCGFGPFRRRRSDGLHEPLFARAAAFEAGKKNTIIISCDLIGIKKEMTDKTRSYISEQTGVPPDAVMIACTHTHSGPATVDLVGWGEKDQRYISLLPGKIARAAKQAYENMTESELSAAEVPVKGIAFNRVYHDKGPLDDTALVLKITSGEKLKGFISFYSVHPVVCCEETFKIHGDFVAAASNKVSKEHSDAVGLFLQGACGDINSIYCHKPEDVSLANLEKLAHEYSTIISSGLKKAQKIPVDSINSERKYIKIQQALPDKVEIEQKISEAEQLLSKEDIGDKEQGAVFDLCSSKTILAKLDRNDPLEMEVELQCIALGSIVIIAHPFELFNSIKKQVESSIPGKDILVVGYANDYLGYAPTADRFELDGKEGRNLCYAAHKVPLIRGDYLFTSDIERTLVEEMTELCKKVSG